MERKSGLVPIACNRPSKKWGSALYDSYNSSNLASIGGKHLSLGMDCIQIMKHTNGADMTRSAHYSKFCPFALSLSNTLAFIPRPWRESSLIPLACINFAVYLPQKRPYFGPIHTTDCVRKGCLDSVL